MWQPYKLQQVRHWPSNGIDRNVSQVIRDERIFRNFSLSVRVTLLQDIRKEWRRNLVRILKRNEIFGYISSFQMTAIFQSRSRCRVRPFIGDFLNPERYFLNQKQIQNRHKIYNSWFRCSLKMLPSLLGGWFRIYKFAYRQALYGTRAEYLLNSVQLRSPYITSSQPHEILVQ